MIFGSLTSYNYLHSSTFCIARSLEMSLGVLIIFFFMAETEVASEVDMTDCSMLSFLALGLEEAIEGSPI